MRWSRRRTEDEVEVQHPGGAFLAEHLPQVQVAVTPNAHRVDALPAQRLKALQQTAGLAEESLDRCTPAIGNPLRLVTQQRPRCVRLPLQSVEQLLAIGARQWFRSKVGIVTTSSKTQVQCSRALTQQLRDGSRYPKARPPRRRSPQGP
jgi:hypothetical protein